MSRLFRFLALCFAVAASLSGQSTWTAIPSPTTSPLWSVCHGGSQFVAVGDNGAILTSTDGLSWTPRVSATSEHLVAVAYGLDHFVATGANQTVLTSRDGITWRRISDIPPTGTTRESLNTVIFHGSSFLIFGDRWLSGGLNLPTGLSYPESSNRPNSPSTTTPPNLGLRSVALGHGRLVLGTESGLRVASIENLTRPWAGVSHDLPATVRDVSGVVFEPQRGRFTAVAASGAIFSSTDATTWSRERTDATDDLHAIAAFNNTLIAVGAAGAVLSPDASGAWLRQRSLSTETFRGIAASDSVAIVVGGAGSIFRSTADPLAPTIVSQPVALSERIGGAAAFAVEARGSGQLRYQWYFNDVALSGEIHRSLSRAPLSLPHGGRYKVVVSNSVGSVTSQTVNLTLEPEAGAIVDPKFNADPSITGGSVLLPLSDGSIIAAGGKVNQVVKLLSDGRLDPAWATGIFTPSGEPPAASYFTGLARQPDGRILVSGSFSAFDGTTRKNLLRLNPDGTLDPSFSPAEEVARSDVLAIALQNDGRILVANSQTVPYRLLADGRLDSTFRPQPITPTMVGNFTLSWRTVSVDISPDQKIYVAREAGILAQRIQPASTTEIHQLRADGSIDTAFTGIGLANFLYMRALDDDGVIATAGANATVPSSITSITITRRRADGTAVYGKTIPARFPAGGADPIVQLAYPSGELVYQTTSEVATRLTPSGTEDTSFAPGAGRFFPKALDHQGRLLITSNSPTHDGQPIHRIARLLPIRNEERRPPRILDMTADKQVVLLGESLTVRAAVTGSGSLSYEWSDFPGGPVSARTRTPEYTFKVAATTRPTLTLRNMAGTATSTLGRQPEIRPAAPVIVSQPTRVSTQSGRNLQLQVVKNDTSGTLEIEWRRDGQLLTPDSSERFSPTLNRSPVTKLSAGTYTMTLRNIFDETVTSAPIVVTVDDSSRFTNLSTRVVLDARDPLAIIGFTLAGPTSREFVIRGIGPGLARFGVTGVVADPALTLFNSAGQVQANNENWSSSAAHRRLFDSLGAFALDEGSTDSALVTTLSPGAYTVWVRGKPGQTGTALLEIYESHNDADTLLNLSTRAFVGPGAPAIAGLTIRGPVPKPVLIRVAGPALTTFGVSNALPNPRLVLRNSQGAVVGTNDDWDSAATLASMQSVGAFPFTPGSRDAALHVTLPPGDYTATVETADTGSGIALIEVYESP